MTTTTCRAAPTPPTDHRFVDPDDLHCPVCDEQVRCQPPGFWVVSDGLPVPPFSHHDGWPLCRGDDGRVTDPIEVRPPC